MNIPTDKTSTRPQSTRLFSTRTTLTALASLALLSAACADTPDEPTPLVQSQEIALFPAPNCNTVRERVIDTTTERALRQIFKRYHVGEWGYNEDANPDFNRSPRDYAETNLQEIGQDEPDIIKTDATYTYTINDNELLILKSSPADPSTLVGRHTLRKNSSALSLLLKDDRVILFSTLPGTTSRTGSQDETSLFRGTRVTILNVSDRTAPKIENQLDIEGELSSARMIDGKVYLVSQSQVESPINLGEWIPANISNLSNPEWTDDTDLLEQRQSHARTFVRRQIAQELAKFDIQSLLPRTRTTDADGNILSTAPLYECHDLYFPRQITNLGLRNISSFDLVPSTTNQPTQIQSTGLFADGWTVYTTGQNLYAAMSNRSWIWGHSNIPTASHIHKFALKNTATQSENKPAYTASGKVDGWLLNQFSMSEFDGHLRVATTDNQWNWHNLGGPRTQNAGSNLIVLQQQNNVLQETGAIRGFAPAEHIYGARMTDDHGYLTSFLSTDPSYPLDLSDPTNPKILAPLEINR